MMATVFMISAISHAEGGAGHASNDACSPKATPRLADNFADGGVEGDVSCDGSASVATMIAAAVFPTESLEDDYDNSCSVCLEDFCDSNPSTSTSCNHEFHLHCILEWSQRGKECPMCWQPLSLKDTDSQSLLAASQEQRHRMSHRSPFFHQSSAPAASQGYRFEDRTTNGRTRVQRDLQRRASEPSSRHTPSLENQDEARQNASLSEAFTLKSRLVAASFKYRDSFSKTTRGLRERLRMRNHSDLGSRPTEVHAGSARLLRDEEH